MQGFYAYPCHTRTSKNGGRKTNNLYALNIVQGSAQAQEQLIQMFNEEELKHYEKVLNRLGLKDGESQQRVLEFVYTLGTIIYNKSVETGIIAFNMTGVHPHDASTIFDERDICLRAGHHCAQLITSWLGCVGTLRASFYIYNDEQDVQKFIETVKQAADYFKEWNI